MDFATGGDLQKRIKHQRTKKYYFAEPQIIDWFTQICLAIKHIHDKKILHRDLKSQNIFLTENGLIKLGDFGIAKCLNFTMEKVSTIVGTPYYLSPEIVQNQPYNFKSDIWSLGVLLFEMMALKMPFDANSLPMLSLKIIRGNYGNIPSNFSADLKNLLKTLLNVDASKRPTIHEILKTPIIVKRIKNFLNEVEYSNEFSHTILHNYNIFSNKKAEVDKKEAKAPASASQVNSVNTEKTKDLRTSNVSEASSNSNVNSNSNSNTANIAREDSKNSNVTSKSKGSDIIDFFNKNKGDSLSSPNKAKIANLGKDKPTLNITPTVTTEDVEFELNKDKADDKLANFIKQSNEGNSKLPGKDIAKELESSHRMLVELSKLNLGEQEPSKSPNSQAKSQDDLDGLLIQSNSADAEEVKDNVIEKDDKDKEESVVSQKIDFSSKEEINNLTQEIIGTLGERIYKAAYKLVYENTPKEHFYYNMESISQKMDEDLVEFKEEKVELAKKKIPELFSLAFEQKQKEFLISFANNLKKK
mmetsp:Transcript_27914/g.29086  ORF Transcript_27914/g.29086 Transcript_27914/m.29086 type:complete len:529 (-) Transcript_27914:57-1643(-)